MPVSFTVFEAIVVVHCLFMCHLGSGFDDSWATDWIRDRFEGMAKHGNRGTNLRLFP